MIQSPAYYRARLSAIAAELKRETDDQRIKLLQNGYYPDYSPSPLSQSSHDARPLTFLEICSWDTWFAMHPEKVCGEIVTTASRSFPLKVKANANDVIQTVTKGMEAAQRIRIAKAKLKLLKLTL